MLREQRRMSGKELAEALRMSQSQISRLESGQRNVSALLLSELSRIFAVQLSHFFPNSQDPKPASSRTPKQQSGSLATVEDSGRLVVTDQTPIEHVGKLIRRERRKKHITADNLARAISKGASWVRELEGGATENLTGEMVQRVAKALKVQPKVLYDAQRNHIRYLQLRIQAMEQAYANRTRGQLELEDGQTRDGLPILGTIGDRLELGADGIPGGEVQDYLYVPNIHTETDFALYLKGEEMHSKGNPSFEDGDLLLFSVQRELRHRDFALVVMDTDVWLFRRLFFDPRGVVRLQPLNLDYAPHLCHRDEVKRLYCLTGHVQKL
jgi:transcriptional regulator with XRE-family HTH domain